MNGLQMELIIMSSNIIIVKWIEIVMELQKLLNYYLERVCAVVASCGQSRIVVATTSGEGAFSKNSMWNRLLSLVVKFKPCRLLNFSECEVKLYFKRVKS